VASEDLTGLRLRERGRQQARRVHVGVMAGTPSTFSSTAQR
jgi:hypothetical protein